MRLQKVRIRNFRLLREVELAFNDKSTVIVGRNNSGKTSLAEIFKRVLSERIRFELEDFSLGVYEQFWTAYEAAKKKEKEEDIRKKIPCIEMELVVGYDKTATTLGPISDFVVDLNPDCAEVLISLKYELGAGGITTFFAPVDVPAGGSEKVVLFKALKQRIPNHFECGVSAVDPNDPTNRKPMEVAQLRALLRSGFINAQRGLDDKTDRENVVLGKILEILFKTAKSANAPKNDQDTAKMLEAAVQGVQTGIDQDFSKQLDGLLPAFKIFGYPRLPDPQLRTETVLNVEALLSGHTKIRYTGANGVNLPEAYNGLGTRNLIFILLKLLEFFKAHQTADVAGINLVFIEEPEAHLHPQMQEVFIAKLAELAQVFADTYSEGRVWPVQFVVTTHSSHLANRVPFRNLRYFLAVADDSPNVCKTKIKDLAQGFSADLKADEEFLHQYMTLTCCDLMFADKAVMIEGTAERILLPKFIERTDAALDPECRLSSQYVSVLEVGGAYAHKFFKLLEFLELPALVITDIDAVNSKNNNSKCLVSEADRSSNGCINSWFPGVAMADLIKKTAADKVSGKRRIAFQIAEEDEQPVGRSFEEAFVLANLKKYSIAGATSAEIEKKASDTAAGLGKKSEVALTLAISDTAWNTPKYITEGLLWLVEDEIKAARVAKEAAAKNGDLLTKAVKAAGDATKKHA